MVNVATIPAVARETPALNTRDFAEHVSLCSTYSGNGELETWCDTNKRELEMRLATNTLVGEGVGGGGDFEGEPPLCEGLKVGLGD